jgi:mono/diheme cytochrome c family protein
LPALPVSAQTLAERGKFLVEKVGHCGDCHTPTTAAGKPDVNRFLKGVNGRQATPDITSSGELWANWKEEGFLNFLERGMAPSGSTARHPMPAYKLRPDDAESIIQYLKTVK